MRIFVKSASSGASRLSLLIEYYQSNQIQEDKNDGACGEFTEKIKAYGILMKKSKLKK
jgi:hypothetical protein